MRDGILNHRGSGMPATLEGKIVRIVDRIAYINHDIDDAIRAGIIRDADLPADAIAVLGTTSSARINRMVTDVVTETLAAGLSEVRMTDAVLGATLALRSFMFSAVYENPQATAEFEKAEGILGGIWEKVRQRPAQYLDPVTIESEGLDAATRDFVVGMTDRYAVGLFEALFVPKSWSGIGQ